MSAPTQEQAFFKISTQFKEFFKIEEDDGGQRKEQERQEEQQGCEWRSTWE